MCCSSIWKFLSTPSARRATCGAGATLLAFLFLSTPSARRATYIVIDRIKPILISIHALREEGDQDPDYQKLHPKHFYPRPPRGGRQPSNCSNSSLSLFLSTPSARRATSCHEVTVSTSMNFYPRPPRGGRRHIPQTVSKSRKFLSTPSARRATPPKLPFFHRPAISIHALREEGD